MFHLRIRTRPTNEYLVNHHSWLSTMRMLDSVSSLIMVRSISRVIEKIQARDGYLLGHEWTMYVFDSVPMVVVVALFYVWYLSNLWGANRGRESELSDLQK